MQKYLLASLFCFLCNPALANEVIVMEFYNDKGLMGKQTTTIPSNTQAQVATELSWNNRRVNINETYVFNKQGYPIKVDVKGISAFGAPVNESFEWVDGTAKWNSRADEGAAASQGDKFYLTVDGIGTDALVRRLLKEPFNQIDLLPSGSAKLNKVTSTEVKHGNKQKTVYLYAISGLNLTPLFVWTDENGYLFSLNIGGFIKGIRQGWSLETFETLKNVSEKSENEYYQGLSNELTHKLEGDLLIKNANVVDVEKKTLLVDYDVLVSQGKITSLNKNIQSKNAKIIDAKGKTLIPGLWDMHGHLSKTDGFNYLAAGVTTVRDIGNSPDNMALLEQQYRNTLLGTHIYKAGFIDKQSDFSAGNGITVNSLEEAKEAVDWYADRGYIQIKTYSSMDPSWVKELAAHIHKRGLRLSGHIPAFMSAEQAVNAGFDEIQHVNMLFLNFLAGDKLDTRKLLRFSLIGEQAKDLDLSSEKVQDFVQMLADKQIEVDLTVSTFNSLLLTRDKKMDPEYQAIAEHLPPLFQRGLKTATMKIDTPEMDQSYKQGAAALLNMTKLLFDKGVPIIPGTDYYTGFTLLRELELYSMAGIPNIDVLAIATLNSAKVVGDDSLTGSISPGKYADMVLIDGNPLENMSDLHKASLVIQRDRMFQPDKIYQSMGVKPFVVSTSLK